MEVNVNLVNTAVSTHQSPPPPRNGKIYHDKYAGSNSHQSLSGTGPVRNKPSQGQRLIDKSETESLTTGLE